MRPDFSLIPYAVPPGRGSGSSVGEPCLTPEHITVKPVYMAADLARARSPRVRGRSPAVSARAVLHDVRPAAVDRPAVCRLLDGGGVERVLPAEPGGRTEGTVGCVRSRHASGLRLGQRTRSRGRRQGRRRDRHGRGHEDPLRSDPARSDVGIDDHERRRAPCHGLLYRCGRRAGRRSGTAERDHSERHPEGVHGSQYVHLPADAVDAHHRRYLPVLRRTDAAFQCHLDQRISHAGGRCDGRHRARLHAGRRPRVRAHGAGGRADHRQFCSAAQFLLGHWHEPLHGDCQAARSARAVGPADQGVQSDRTRNRWRCGRIRRPQAGA